MTSTFTREAMPVTKPANRGAPWNEKADAELRRRVAARESVGAIARAMGRTQDAIRGRADQLRITVPSSLRPWRDSPSKRPTPEQES